MPKLAPHVLPAYRLHKQSGQAVVTLNGKDILLGRHGSPASREAYNRATGQWLAAGRQSLKADQPFQVVELLSAFLDHAKQYYRKPDGTQTTEVDNFVQAMRPLRELYGRTPAVDFGPLALKVVRDDMIKNRKWCRTNANKQIGRIRQMFRWGAENELIPGAIHQSLAAVAGLKAGRSDAEESEPVKPVSDAIVSATVLRLSTQVATMVNLQRLTGMRPGEVCSMRWQDIDRSGEQWIYRLIDHKNRHHGHDRIVPFGPRAVALLTPLLKDDSNRFVFDPQEAEATRHDKQSKARLESGTPMSCGNRRGTNRKAKPQRSPGDHYDVAAYRRAISRACDAAFPPPAHLSRLRIKGKKGKRWETAKEWQQRLADCWPELQQWQSGHRWHPHQLRHSAATEIRREFGVEAAGVILGHKTLKTTELYAEKNVNEAKRIMNLVG